ncbi:MAG: sugar ABC transporter permease [Oscillospiraceae bacterium]|nr:sugar ABC transporter permease [Oscillospiraceae bacterium]
MANRSGGRIRSISYAKYGYIFILPFFLVYAIFQIYPLFNTFYLSFFGNGKKIDEFVGFENFKTLLFGGGFAQQAAHDSFIRVLSNTFILWFGNFIPQIILSLVLAAWFTNARLKIPGKGAYKIIMYMPNIITAASAAALFVMLFSDSQLGAINAMLLKNGFTTETISFVSGKTEARVMIMIIQTWMWYGNTTIMLMSGIMGINGSLFEAASIDGASHTQQFFRITLPLLRPILLYTVVTSMIGGLQMYDMPALYNVGTSQNKFTETIAVYIFNNFHDTSLNNFGYSAAASVILFVITSVLGSVCFAINRDKDVKVKKSKKTSKLL